MDFFRNKSEHISRFDQASANLDAERKEAKRLLDKDPLAPQPIDHSSLVNAAIAAKDETIASLREQIQTKDELIASLRQQVAMLQQQRGLENYPFKMGTAEPANPPQKDI